MGGGLDATLIIVLFLVATFIAALIAGLAGFAFGLVAAAVWVYILTPLQTATLIIGFGIIVQGYAVWKLRHALAWSRVVPMVMGAAFGVPLGVVVLATARPDYLRAGIGAVLVLYALYGLLRPSPRPFAVGGAAADIGAGFFNGVLGGATGLAGIIATIWCQLRGWPKDQQRAVFQPVGVATFAMSAAWLGAGGAISHDVVWMFVLGLPVLLAGTWAGLNLYGRLDEAQFRTVVLVLLLLSGLVMVFRQM
jgi:uncharacterized membrane protein YfcA